MIRKILKILAGKHWFSFGSRKSKPFKVSITSQGYSKSLLNFKNQKTAEARQRIEQIRSENDCLDCACCIELREMFIAEIIENAQRDVTRFENNLEKQSIP